jgi:hypothetical protein
MAQMLKNDISLRSVFESMPFLKLVTSEHIPGLAERQEDSLLKPLK